MMKTARNPDQPRLFVLPDEGVSQQTPAPLSNFTEMDAYRRVKETGDEAQQVRDRIFVDRPDTYQEFLAQARRNVRAGRAYVAAWELAIASGFGPAVVQQIVWERQKPRKIIRFPARNL